MKSTAPAAVCGRRGRHDEIDRTCGRLRPRGRLAISSMEVCRRPARASVALVLTATWCWSSTPIIDGQGHPARQHARHGHRRGRLAISSMEVCRRPARASVALVLTATWCWSSTPIIDGQGHPARQHARHGHRRGRLAISSMEVCRRPARASVALVLTATWCWSSTPIIDGQGHPARQHARHGHRRGRLAISSMEVCRRPARASVALVLTATWCWSSTPIIDGQGHPARQHARHGHRRGRLAISSMEVCRRPARASVALVLTATWCWSSTPIIDGQGHPARQHARHGHRRGRLAISFQRGG